MPPWAVVYALSVLLTALVLFAVGLPVLAVGLLVIEAVALGLLLLLRR